MTAEGSFGRLVRSLAGCPYIVYQSNYRQFHISKERVWNDVSKRGILPGQWPHEQTNDKTYCIDRDRVIRFHSTIPVAPEGTKKTELKDWCQTGHTFDRSSSFSWTYVTKCVLRPSLVKMFINRSF